MGDCSEKTCRHRTVFKTPSPLGCSQALHGIKHTSKTFPRCQNRNHNHDKNGDWWIIDSVIPAFSCCCLFFKISRLRCTSFPESAHVTLWCAAFGKKAQQIQYLLVIFVEILNVIANKVSTWRFQLTHMVCWGLGGATEVELPNERLILTRWDLLTCSLMMFNWQRRQPNVTRNSQRTCSPLKLMQFH